MLKDIVIRKVKKLRKEKHFSIAEVSEKMGFSSPMGYANIEHGRIKITLEQLEQLSDIYNTPILELLGYQDYIKENEDLKRKILEQELVIQDNERVITFYKKRKESLQESITKSSFKALNIDFEEFEEKVEYLLNIVDYYALEIAGSFPPNELQSIIEDSILQFKKAKEHIEESENYIKLSDLDKDVVMNFLTEFYDLFEIDLPIRRPSQRLTDPKFRTEIYPYGVYNLLAPDAAIQKLDSILERINTSLSFFGKEELDTQALKETLQKNFEKSP